MTKAKLLSTYLLFLLSGSVLLSQAHSASILDNQHDHAHKDPLAKYCNMNEPVDYEAEAKLFKMLKSSGKHLQSQRSVTPVTINVTAHKIFPTNLPLLPCFDPDGKTPTDDEINDDIFYTTQWFEDANFNVQLNLANINEICNSSIYDITDFSISQMETLNDIYGVVGHFNIYYTNSGSKIGGFPWVNNTSLDDMMLHRNTHAGWGWTVIHEFGHWFGLLHTHESASGTGSGGPGGVEMVVRTSTNPCYNCETTGDLLCDTPADYGLDFCDEEEDDCSCSNQSDPADCSNASGTIINGITDDCAPIPYLYAPDLMNVMSYGCRPCAKNFTTGQIERMWVYVTDRLLQASITHNGCPDDITLSGSSNVGHHAEAHQIITSSESVETESYVLYDGGVYVDLLPGFCAGSFDVIIDNEVVTKHSNLEIVNEGCYGSYQLTEPNTPVDESVKLKLESILENKN